MKRISMRDLIAERRGIRRSGQRELHVQKWVGDEREQRKPWVSFGSWVSHDSKTDLCYTTNRLLFVLAV